MTILTSGAALKIFDELASTQSEAKRMADEGVDRPVWIVARRQTGGYGRRGREWLQRDGDFSGTLAFKNPDGFKAIGELTFIAGLAVVGAIEASADRGDVRIKWPNDILIDRKKVSGILLEMVEEGAVACMGIGVNLVSSPDGLDYPTTRLADFSRAAPRLEDFAAVLDEEFWRAHRLWRKCGFQPVRERWLSKCVGVGEEITVRLPTETLSGVFESIDKNGAMLLRSGEETRIIRAGDVFFEA